MGICCFAAKHTALRRKNKDWLTWNPDNVSEWGMSIRGLLSKQLFRPKRCLSTFWIPSVINEIQLASLPLQNTETDITNINI
jgi:hypothetical protein